MTRVLGLFIFLFISACTSAPPSSPSPQEIAASSAQVKEIMGQIFNEFVSLRPFLISDATFSAPTNQADIQARLARLSALSREAHHEPLLKNTGFRFSREVFERHVSEAERVFKTGNPTYARWMLNSTGGVCLSCHEQLPSSASYQPVEVASAFASPFDQAEFYFLSRQFDKAADIFQKLVKTYPSSKLTADQLETALDRLLTVHARVRRSPADAVKMFKNLSTNSRLPTNQKRRIKQWLTELTSWQKEGKPADNASDETRVRALAETLVARADRLSVENLDRQSVIYARLSGVLYDYVNTHTVSEFTPQAFYWLALCDRHTRKNFFYSLGDMYLRECMERWPASPVAKDCFKEFEEGVVSSYSGSRGTQIPEDVQAEVEVFRNKVFPKQ